eukprot:scaffold577766_cov46-Prasinocladus_malaysianus.AAC.1
MVTLCGNSLQAASLGDAGYAVIRRGKLIHRSQPQLHGKDRPYQLGYNRLLALHDCWADTIDNARRATMPIK